MRLSFTVRTIGDWNILPATAVEQNTLGLGLGGTGRELEAHRAKVAFKAELAKLHCQQATPVPYPVAVHSTYSRYTP